MCCACRMAPSKEKALSLQLKEERQAAKDAIKAERKAKCEMEENVVRRLLKTKEYVVSNSALIPKGVAAARMEMAEEAAAELKAKLAKAGAKLETERARHKEELRAEKSFAADVVAKKLAVEEGLWSLERAAKQGQKAVAQMSALAQTAALADKRRKVAQGKVKVAARKLKSARQKYGRQQVKVVALADTAKNKVEAAGAKERGLASELSAYERDVEQLLGRVATLEELVKRQKATIKKLERKVSCIKS